MEKMMTEENFIKAEILMAKNKKRNKKAKYIGNHAKEYGSRLFAKVQSGEFHWHPYRVATIKDSYKGKTRNLKIPCLEDQAVQLAWLNIAIPYIEKKNYYYNCGSIPKAGQTRAVKALQKWLKNPRMKYGASLDIKKFYDTLPHSVVRKGLERIFKDREFVDFAMGFVASMSDTDVGIAIGYPSSHWLANVALMELDHEISRRFTDVKFTRYMDDIAMVSPNKRHLRKAVQFVKTWIDDSDMKLKKWSSFPIKGRGLTFLSYRFFNGFTLMTKRLMYRIARRMRRASEAMSAHIASGIMSYFGILKHCDSFNFRQMFVYPFINKRTCIKLIKGVA